MTDSAKSEQRIQALEVIHDNAVDAIVTIDERGTIETVNPATEKLFGYSPPELIGRNVNVLMPNPYHDEHDGYLKNYRDSHIRKIIGIGREVTALRKDGVEFPIHLAVSEIIVGDRRSFVGFIRDLTVTKQAEAHLQSKILINERLAAIGQMVSGLAHESRNAFQRSHACLAELALDLEDMPDSLELVNKVQKALDDLNLVLEEVRCYAAPIILERRPCNVSNLFKETWQNVLETKSYTTPPKLNIDIQPGFPDSCMIDGDRMKIVIRNLLDNAAFACNTPGKVRVNLRYHKHADDDERTIRWEVIDNGNGIPAELRETIFEPFYTTKTKGTGLGLALSRRYVESHEGRISATAADHGGARLVVEFPFCQRRPGRTGAKNC